MRIYNKNKKAFLIFSCLFLLFFIQFGYSYLNSALNINGNIDINKNTWDVHFENVVLIDGSVDATTPATIVDDTTVNFAATFQNQGESYEFEVDVVNSGSIDAMLSEVVKTDLVANGIEYLDYSVSYSNGVSLNVGDALNASSKQTLKIVIKYKDDITEEQIPTEEKITTVSLKLNYVQDDGTGVGPFSLFSVVKTQSVLDNIASTYVTTTTGVDFSKISSDTNGKGVYTVSSTKDNDFPIYYYRGSVTNNNVIFAGFCWKMVRTTDTGGVKMIYNGVPSSSNTCSNSGTSTQIGTSAFNSTITSLADVGYMYGTRYEENTKEMSTDVLGDISIVYGNDVSYDTTTGKYTLLTTTTSKVSEWSTDFERIVGANGYHYTCFNDSNTCSEVSYIYYHDSTISTGSYGTSYYINLTGGKKISDALDIMFNGDNDSIIKASIDTWYTSNMTGYTSMLEDTVWCNDRSIHNYGGWQKDSSGLGVKLSFASYERVFSTYEPTFSCSNKNDAFTMDDVVKGNGKLTYPVGLLTSDEVMYAGGIGDDSTFSGHYLDTKVNFWVNSPMEITKVAFVSKENTGGCASRDPDSGYCLQYKIYSGFLDSISANNAYGVRPVISLKNGVVYTDGDGTNSTPYIVNKQ